METKVHARCCVALVRRRSTTAAVLERSQKIYKDVVEPAAVQCNLSCMQIDPTDYGVQDERLFALLTQADVLIVDASSQSNDYMYSLGVRHAITRKPTFVLQHVDHLPFDLLIPRGIIRYADDHLRSGDLMHKLIDEINDALRSEDSVSYSPVRDALESIPRVFLSYAHADQEAVAAVDQWLRDHGVRVDIDEREFIAGRDLRNEIVRCIQMAGKVICFYSKHSNDRYFTNLERRVTEELENHSHNAGEAKNIMIYFRLDETKLPLECSGRLAINAWQKNFEDACRELIRHLVERSGESKRVPLSRYKKRAPWHKNT